MFSQFETVISSGIHTQCEIAFIIHDIESYVHYFGLMRWILSSKHFTNVCNQKANGKLFTWQNTEDSLSPCKRIATKQ